MSSEPDIRTYGTHAPRDVREDRRKFYGTSQPEASLAWDNAIQDRRLALAYARFLKSEMHYRTIAGSDDKFCTDLVNNLFKRWKRGLVRPMPEPEYAAVVAIDKLEACWIKPTATKDPDCLGEFSSRGKQYHLYQRGESWVTIGPEGQERSYRYVTSLPKGATDLVKNKI